VVDVKELKQIIGKQSKWRKYGIQT
jgi:hypothetical protein